MLLQYVSTSRLCSLHVADNLFLRRSVSQIPPTLASDVAFLVVRECLDLHTRSCTSHVAGRRCPQEVSHASLTRSCTSHVAARRCPQEVSARVSSRVRARLTSLCGDCHR